MKGTIVSLLLKETRESYEACPSKPALLLFDCEEMFFAVINDCVN